MNLPSEDPNQTLRRSVYWLLIALSIGSVTGRILAVDSVDTLALEKHLRREDPNRELQRPFLSANDRSRWCTVRALVEHGTYQIDEVIQERGWDTIDMVKHDGHLYSSKPPLLATLIAAEYWVLHQITGSTLGESPHALGRFMLATINIPALLVCFLLLVSIVERYGNSDWGRIFVIAAATWATLMTTFAATLNNHLIAAAAATAALWATLRIWQDGSRRLDEFVLAGAAAAFCAANELPALSLAAACTLAIFWKAPRQAIIGFVPAAAVVAGAFFATNYAAHGSMIPPYAHREEGENWYDYEYERNGRTIHSYWQNRSGIDLGEASPVIYAVNVLVGHHGVFSLTPVWLLSFLGLGLMLTAEDRSLRWIALAILGLSVVCFAFYLSRPLIDRNYGGTTSGFRWMMWFAPLWLFGMLPAADAAAERRWARAICLVLLMFSVLSVAYPTWNPWTHPWLWDASEWMGWM